MCWNLRTSLPQLVQPGCKFRANNSKRSTSGLVYSFKISSLGGREEKKRRRKKETEGWRWNRCVCGCFLKNQFPLSCCNVKKECFIKKRERILISRISSASFTIYSQRGIWNKWPWEYEQYCQSFRSLWFIVFIRRQGMKISVPPQMTSDFFPQCCCFNISWLEASFSKNAGPAVLWMLLKSLIWKWKP